MDKVDELRKQLKDAKAAERASALTESDGPPVSATSADIERYTPNLPHQDGYSLQPVSRPGLGTVSVGRAISDPQRKLADLFGSSASGDPAKRRANRRSSENHSQDRPDGIDVSASAERSVSGTEQVRRVGNLETTDTIPPRLFDAEREAAIEKSETQGTAPARKRGRPPKQRDSGIVQEISAEPNSNSTTTIPAEKRKSFFSTGKTLSKQEAKELAEPLVSALTDEMEQIDKLIWKYTNDPLEQPIWSDVTEKEMESLTSIILKLGQKSPAMATVARTAVDADDYIVAGMVVGPRFMKTVDVIRTARRTKRRENPPQPSRIERLRARRKQVTEPAS